MGRQRSWAITTMAWASTAMSAAARIGIRRNSGSVIGHSAGRRGRSRRIGKSFCGPLQPEIRFEADGKRFRLVHGSPRRMNEYLFEDRPLSSFQRLAATSDADVLLFGHTHKPYTKRVDGVLFVNAGSVGKPKDGDPRACYVVMDTAGDVAVEFRRIRYNIDVAAMAIRESSLPDKFADDIETGGAVAPTTAAPS